MSELRTKVCFLGNAGVGKTCILNRKTKNIFDTNSLSTMGANYSLVTEEVKETKIILDCWDTAGQEKYRSLGRMFYADAHIVILVYDITRKESFEDLEKVWVKEIEENCEPDILKIVCANKFDLFEEEQVKEDDGRAFAEKIGARFCPSSAKTGNGIDRLFLSCAEVFYEREKGEGEVVKKEENNNNSGHTEESSRIKIEEPTGELKERKKKGCCK